MLVGEPKLQIPDVKNHRADQCMIILYRLGIWFQDDRFVRENQTTLLSRYKEPYPAVSLISQQNIKFSRDQYPNVSDYLQQLRRWGEMGLFD